MGNIFVDDIHAGTQLSDDEVSALNLPNLIPRSCGVDIRPNTVVNIDDSNGIAVGDDISGYHTCYDDGEAANEYTTINLNRPPTFRYNLSMSVIVLYIQHRRMRDGKALVRALSETT